MDHLFAAWLPSPQSGGMTETPRRLSNHFHGDVTTDVADGINADPHSFQATWILHQDAADTLLDFLRAHVCKAFVWAAPRDTVERIWEATDWSRGSDEDRDIIQVTFEERFMATINPPPLPPPPPPEVILFTLDSSLLDGTVQIA